MKDINLQNGLSPLAVNNNIEKNNCLIQKCSTVPNLIPSPKCFSPTKQKFSTSTDLSSPSSVNRRPFHYPMDGEKIGQVNYGTFYPEIKNKDNSNDTGDPCFDQHLTEALSVYSRYRYYHRLFNNPNNQVKNTANINGNHNNSGHILIIPDHVIPWYFILPKISVPSFEVADDRKQSSIVTIFAIWNMMMGTSLLCLPWAYHRAGLVGGFLVMLTMTTLCFFTASLVIKVPRIISVQVNEFTDVCSVLLGPVAHKIAQISSLSILASGCIVYWVLMTNFLRHIIGFAYQVQFLNITVGLNASSVICPTEQIVDAQTEIDQSLPSVSFVTILDYAVPAILVLVLGPIMCLRSVSFFLRFNIIGTVSVFYLLGFALFKSYNWGLVHLSLDPSSVHYVPLFSWNFPIYSGVLSLALFIHNCVTTLLRTQKHPENNQRDLAIAYFLVGITYLLIGTAIYVSFPLAKDCLRDNFLDNFESNDLFAFVSRIFLLLQVVALFPLLVYMLRVQVLSMFQDNTNRNGAKPSCQLVRIVVLNVALLTAGILFATFYPQIGSIIRYCGSFSGLILIFVLPSITFIRARTVADKPIGPLGLFAFGIIMLLGLANFLTQFFVDD